MLRGWELEPGAAPAPGGNHDLGREEGRVSRPAGLHPAEPPAKRVYHKVAHPSKGSRGMRPSLSVSKDTVRPQHQAANTTSSSADSSAGRWRPKSPPRWPWVQASGPTIPGHRTPPEKRAKPVTPQPTQRCASGPSGSGHGTHPLYSRATQGARNDGHRLNPRAPAPLYAGIPPRHFPSPHLQSRRPTAPREGSSLSPKHLFLSPPVAAAAAASSVLRRRHTSLHRPQRDPRGWGCRVPGDLHSGF